MNLLQIIFDFFSGKAKTRIYTTFLGWVLVFHLDIIFIAIFTDQDLIYKKTTQLKGDYIVSYIFHFGQWSVPIELARFVAAVMVTFLMIWVIPKFINKLSYKQELDVEYELREMKLLKEEKLNDREKDAAEKQLKNVIAERNAVEKQLETVKAEREVIAERAKITDTPEQVRWDSDFNKFKKTSAYTYFDDIIKIIYDYSGRLSSATSIRPSSEVIAYLDSNEVLRLEQGFIYFTEKGKYFVKKYTEGD